MCTEGLFAKVWVGDRGGGEHHRLHRNPGLAAAELAPPLGQEMWGGGLLDSGRRVL